MKKKAWFIILIGFLVALDQFTKIVAVEVANRGVKYYEVFSFLAFEYSKNHRGFALPVEVSPSTVIAIRGACLLLVVWAFARSTNRWYSFSFALLLAGVIGNGFDFVLFEHIVDFISFNISWFVFNLADIFLTVGLLILFIKERRRTAKQPY